MNIPCVVFGLLFSAAGLLFAAGKLHGHLSVWKQMPREEQEQINIVPLCRNIGMMIALAGVFFLLSGFVSFIQEHCFTWLMIAWLIGAGLDVFLIGKSKRYKRQ